MREVTHISDPDLLSLSYARLRLASALESLADAAEWTGTAAPRSGGMGHVERLNTARKVLWGIAGATRAIERELAAIHAETQAAQETHENA